MKNKLLSSIAIILLYALPAFVCTGCSMNAYSVQVGGEDRIEVNINEEDIGPRERTINIGGTDYDTKWTGRSQDPDTNKTYDHYELIDSPDKLIPCKITLDSETGEVRRFSFYETDPYPAIENIQNLSDDELKAAVEDMLGDLADFSEYNDFSVNRPSGRVGYNTDIRLSWQVRRELPCSIWVNVVIAEDGLIRSFSKTDSCPDDLSESFLTEEERNKLIEKGVCKDMGIRKLGNVTYKILSETLTCHQGKNALSYTVEIIDEQGFSHVAIMIIS